MSAFSAPVIAWRGSTNADAPLVLLLHGRGSNEADIIGVADHLPAGAGYAAARAPIAEGGGYAWFANRGLGRPVAESLRPPWTGSASGSIRSRPRPVPWS